MKRAFAIVGGLLLIGLGAWLLVNPEGFFVNLNPTIALILFLTASVISLIAYFTIGERHWGVLFPVGVFLGLTAIIGASMLNIDNPMMVMPLFAGIGFPFVVAYFRDRATNWWALIPAGVMFFLMFVMFLTGINQDDWIGSALFFILAAVFGLIYLLRKFLWAAITAYVLFILGFVPLLAGSSRSEYVGVLIMAAISLPFFYVYFRDQNKNWWALIPAGILFSAGATVAAVLLLDRATFFYDTQIPDAVMMAGIALTFGFLWIRHQKRWASIVALIALILAGAQLIGANNIINRWPIILLAVGVFMLVKALLPQKKGANIEKSEQQ